METKPLCLITQQPFFSAVESGDIESLKLIIDQLAQDEVPERGSIAALMSLRNTAGETALYVAADNNLVEMFNYLLNFCEIQIAMIRSKSDLSAFHIAAKRGHLGIYVSFSFSSCFELPLNVRIVVLICEF